MNISEGVSGHVVIMTIDWSDGPPGISVATCDCGWNKRERRSSPEAYQRQDEAIDKHWSEVLSSRQEVGK